LLSNFPKTKFKKLASSERIESDYQEKVSCFGTNLADRATPVKKMTKLHQRLRKIMEAGIRNFNLIESGDCVLVGISGGWDSLGLYRLLSDPLITTPNDFRRVAVHVDLGFQEKGERISTRLKELFEKTGHELVVISTEIGPLVHSDYNRKNPCFLCSRLRRHEIYKMATRLGCNKIAYGHHKDDILETFLINVFFGRELSTMMPRQSIFSGKLHIIRPLVYIEEEMIKKFAQEQEFPLFTNPCPTAGHSKRAYIKALLKQMETDYPNVKKNVWRALFHPKPDYLFNPNLKAGV